MEHMDDLVRTIIDNLTGRNKKPKQLQSVPPAPAPTVPHSSAKGRSSGKTDKGKGDKPVYSCTHTNFKCFLVPCLDCGKLCNCGYRFFPEPEYPDVLIRSSDKKIVRLSKYFVSASGILRSLAIEALGSVVEKENRIELTSKHVEEEDIIITTAHDDPYYVMDFRRLGAGESRAAFDPPTGINGDTVTDLIGWNKDKVLVLFNPDSNEATFGVEKDLLRKLDKFICTHLDEVDRRVTDKVRKDYYFENSGYVKYGHVCYLDIDPKLVNTFAYEDWEDEFFKLGTAEFFDLYQANMELVIVDLHYALEKWMFLGRGFPRAMVNGQYDFMNDPEHSVDDIYDRRNVYGAFNISYINRRRSRLAGPGFFAKNQRYRHGIESADWVPPKWWVIISNHSAPRTVTDK